jgi:predicted AAA+ superfamily ATPase
MRAGELENRLADGNPWWRTATTTMEWHESDADLRDARQVGIDYAPAPLSDIQPDGLYLLLGPRRVGKSVEIKRAIKATLDRRVPGRRVVHAACDDWRPRDLRTLVTVMDAVSPPEHGPRYVFLDEVTAIEDGWPATIKWLRDNSSLRDDCVVLSGSSAADLHDARKALAGRHGRELQPWRTLLPMGFGAFCRVNGAALPDVPAFAPGQLLDPGVDEAIHELRPHLGELSRLWSAYLRVGGLPRAVGDYKREREIAPQFVAALWGVIHGDALAGHGWTAPQTERLLAELSTSLSSLINVSDVARDVDAARETVRRRLERLYHSYIAWPCYQREGWAPKLRAQGKIYFTDPLFARLASLRDPRRHAPDDTQLTEQQLGMTLLRAHEASHPGTFADHDALLIHRSATGAEVDFTAAWLGGIPFEGKYTEGAWRRQTQTAAAAFDGKAVVSTRNVIDRDGNRRAVPAPFLALLLDPVP